MASMLAGLVSGLAATAPMTVAMELLHRRLPERERYPLPPRRITDRVLEAAGVEEDDVSETRRRELALLNHFAYGAAAGALYGPASRATGLPPVASGVVYGLGVWAGSYLGWLPAAGVLPSAARQSARHNALMIAAHVVWGAATGYVAGKLDERGERSAMARFRPTPPERSTRTAFARAR